MKNITPVLALALLLGTPDTADSAGIGRGVQRSLFRRLTKQAGSSSLRRAAAADLARHSKLRVSILKRDRWANRYVSTAVAKKEMKFGIRENRHLTSRFARNPMTPSHAKQRLGLRRDPTFVEFVHLKKGTRVKFEKVTGGVPGRGGIVLHKRSGIPKSEVHGRPLHQVGRARPQ